MKNVVIVAHHYPPHITGVGMVAHDQAKRLAARGNKVTVITSNTRKGEEDAIIDGVTVVRIKAFNGSERIGSPFPIFSFRIFPVMRRLIQNADIVHVHDAFYMSSFWAVLFARYYEKPIVLTQHIAMIPHPSKIVVGIEKLVYATTGRVVFNLSDRIITINDRVETFLIDQGVSKEKIISLPNGVDTDLFHPADETTRQAAKKKFGLDVNKKTVLFVGRFVPKKGFSKVIAARSERYDIVLAGDNPPSEIKSGLFFLGKLPQTALADAYRAADLFVLPSEGEGFPLSVQEAMASGLAVITTNDEGYRRYHLDPTMVFLIDSPSDATVRSAIETLIGNPDRLTAMGVYSREYAEKNFAWHSVLDGLESIYTSATEARRT